MTSIMENKTVLSNEDLASQREDKIVEQLFNGKNVFLSGPGGCLSPTTLVMKADGSLIEARNVKVGDLLMGDDSSPRTVLLLASGIDQMFEIRPKRGPSFICNSTHILTLMRPRHLLEYKEEMFESEDKHTTNISDISFDISLEDFMDMPKDLQKSICMYRVPVNFKKVEVPLDPYILGYWLGNNENSCITSLDKEVIDYFNKCLVNPNIVNNVKYTHERCHYCMINTLEEKQDKFFHKLEKLDLMSNKHIPDIYLYNEKSVRLKLLAGLIDSQGLVYSNSNVEIIQKSKNLSDGIVYLCRSLGYDCENVERNDYYICRFFGEFVNEIPTLIPRKKLYHCPIYKRSNILEFTIIPKGIGPYNGFILDGNQRHLLGDFTVTHNTGKSFSLKNIFHKLTDRGLTVYKTGSTGVSAESIGGMTLHSWAGVMLGDKSAETYFISLKGRNRQAWTRWKKTSVLILDEVSMTGGKFFQMLSDLGKLIRGNNNPFGGLTLLICGDVCQLPPVNDMYFFQSDAYNEMKFEIVRLSHPWRFQKDIDFFFMLSRIRTGSYNSEDILKLEARRVAYYKDIYKKIYKNGEIKPTRMFSKKIDVAEMNNKELNNLPGVEYQYICTDTLKKKSKGGSSSNNLKEISAFQDLMSKTVPSEISLKKDAQVMLTWNLDVDNGLCNGSRGVVIECLDDSVLVRFKNGIEQFINPNVWTIETDDEIFSRSQIPLILAWSTTIHKAQSATLDCVVVDLGTSIFSDNMAYVALSRCRSLEGIYLINLIPEKIKCDPIALDFERTITNVVE